MRSRYLVLSAALLLPVLAAAEDNYRLPGFVTAVEPSGAFEIESVHIRTTPKTEWRTHGSGSSTVPASAPSAFYLGETLDATGYLDRTAHTLTATRIVLVPPSTASVSGTAIIDLIPPASGQHTTVRTVRADGFLLHITAKTKLSFAAPLKSAEDIATNQWIDYSGIQQLDGTVLLDYAGIGPNTVGKSEDKLIARTKYDPDKVTDADHQGSVSKFFKGTDVRRIAPHRDEDMFTRVQRIGQSLIPAYQRALPDADPTKIHFRFQVIDTTKWRDAVSMPNGVIVVPRQVIERMQNDDQLATVIADNIAETIEKEAFRSRTATGVMQAGSTVKTAGILLLSPATLAAGLTTEHFASKAIERTLRQSGRVSLSLLHDAGYDISQAPMAWWLLAPKSPKPIEETPLPPRAITLYVALGTTWHPAPAAETPAPPATP